MHKLSVVGGPSNEYRLWGNLSALTDNGHWLAVLEGKKWQVNPNFGKLETYCKLWIFDNKPCRDLEWDLLEVWWHKPGTNELERFF